MNKEKTPPVKDLVALKVPEGRNIAAHRFSGGSGRCRVIEPRRGGTMATRTPAVTPATTYIWLSPRISAAIDPKYLNGEVGAASEKKDYAAPGASCP